jgi:hypothetical protein
MSTSVKDRFVRVNLACDIRQRGVNPIKLAYLVK